MPITLITKNSVTASKRPTAAQLVTGELGLNAESTDPGLYFEDSAGNIRKVGGAHYGAAAPNVAAAGEAGNSVGELWYNTADAKLYIWDGAAWTVAGGTDTQSFYLAGPWATGVNRPDGLPLLPGDEWYDTSTTPITSYVWDGAAWQFVAINDTHAFTGAGDPTVTNPVTLRPDGTALQDGDLYIDTVAQSGYYYNLALTTWTAFGTDTHAFSGAGDPITLAVAARPNGTALQDGDVYFDTTVGQERAYRYDLATTTWVNADNKTFTQDTLPPAASSFDGDLWYDTNTLESFVYYNDGTSFQWVQQF